VKKLLAGGALAALTLGGIVVGAAPASAHKPDATAACDATANVSYVSANAIMYPADATVVVTIDGAEVESGTFAEVGYESGQNDPQYEYSYENKWETLDPTTEHTWTVSYDSPDGLGVQDFGGTIEPCVEGEPTPEPTPTVPPVTEPEPSEEPTVEPSPVPTDEASVAPVPAPSDEPSASPSPEAEEPPVLAATGATVGGAIAFAALLVAGGIALFWARRRMQNA
jgi:nucleoside 2-deoxyribosyltransferase